VSCYFIPSAYMSQGLGRLCNHHETSLEHSWLCGWSHLEQTTSLLCFKQGMQATSLACQFSWPSTLRSSRCVKACFLQGEKQASTIFHSHRAMYSCISIFQHSMYSTRELPTTRVQPFQGGAKMSGMCYSVNDIYNTGLWYLGNSMCNMLMRNSATLISAIPRVKP
jgi:hypothetical protein